jgi:hypothetical protein
MEQLRMRARIDMHLYVALLLAFSCTKIPAIAGERAQVDLSLEVVVSPRTFTSGGRNFVTMAVHNDGPDVAGASLPNSESIYLLIDQFFIADGGPPFEIRGPVIGCRAEEILGEPNISVTFAFWFESIPPGETHRCTYWIEFYPWIVDSFHTAWQVFTPNDDDAGVLNDRVDFVFEPAGAAPAAVSALSLLGALLLACLMLLTALRFERGRWKTICRSQG